MHTRTPWIIAAIPRSRHHVVHIGERSPCAIIRRAGKGNPRVLGRADRYGLLKLALSDAPYARFARAGDSLNSPTALLQCLLSGTKKERPYSKLSLGCRNVGHLSSPLFVLLHLVKLGKHNYSTLQSCCKTKSEREERGSGHVVIVPESRGRAA